MSKLQKTSSYLLIGFLIGFSSLNYAKEIGTVFSHSSSPSQNSTVQEGNTSITTREMNLYDEARKRVIPIQIYESPTSQHKAKVDGTRRPVVIINHGYTIKNTEYSFLAKNLAAQGYFVVSIQHDLKSDPPLPLAGNIFERRKSLWDRGVANIFFVMKKLQQTVSNIDLSKVTMIGHSNGGDITMLFASIYPDRLAKAISLDSLRMPFPRKGWPPILSIRSNDRTADKGVLPPKKIRRH